MGGQPGAVALLGDHTIKLRLELVAGWGHGSLLIEERDGSLQVAAVVAQLVRGQGVERVLRPVY
jgi:hypothetical protein